MREVVGGGQAAAATWRAGGGGGGRSGLQVARHGSSSSRFGACVHSSPGAWPVCEQLLGDCREPSERAANALRAQPQHVKAIGDWERPLRALLGQMGWPSWRRRQGTAAAQQHQSKLARFSSSSSQD